MRKNARTDKFGIDFPFTSYVISFQLNDNIERRREREEKRFPQSF